MKMKVTKPKDNQLSFEDDALKAFDTKVKSKTGLSKSKCNSLYESFILFYRFKDMEASKQMYMGNRISILTSLTSMLDQLIKAKVITRQDLFDMLELLD